MHIIIENIFAVEKTRSTKYGTNPNDNSVFIDTEPLKIRSYQLLLA
jgi:hypothetical protein